MRECRELEERFGTHFTNDILNKSACSFKEMKKAVMDADKKTRMERYKEKAPMIAELAESPGWCKLWDHALDLGWKTVLGLKMLCRAMSHHGRGEHPCQLCNATLLPEDESVLDHILAKLKQHLHLCFLSCSHGLFMYFDFSRMRTKTLKHIICTVCAYALSVQRSRGQMQT